MQMYRMSPAKMYRKKRIIEIDLEEETKRYEERRNRMRPLTEQMELTGKQVPTESLAVLTQQQQIATIPVLNGDLPPVGKEVREKIEQDENQCVPSTSVVNRACQLKSPFSIILNREPINYNSYSLPRIGKSPLAASGTRLINLQAQIKRYHSEKLKQTGTYSAKLPSLVVGNSSFGDKSALPTATDGSPVSQGPFLLSALSDTSNFQSNVVRKEEEDEILRLKQKNLALEAQVRALERSLTLTLRPGAISATGSPLRQAAAVSLASPANKLSASDENCDGAPISPNVKVLLAASAMADERTANRPQIFVRDTAPAYIQQTSFGCTPNSPPRLLPPLYAPSSHPSLIISSNFIPLASSPCENEIDLPSKPSDFLPLDSKDFFKKKLRESTLVVQPPFASDVVENSVNHEVHTKSETVPVSDNLKTARTTTVSPQSSSRENYPVSAPLKMPSGDVERPAEEDESYEDDFETVETGNVPVGIEMNLDNRLLPPPPPEKVVDIIKVSPRKVYTEDTLLKKPNDLEINAPSGLSETIFDYKAQKNSHSEYSKGLCVPSGNVSRKTSGISVHGAKIKQKSSTEVLRTGTDVNATSPNAAQISKESSSENGENILFKDASAVKLKKGDETHGPLASLTGLFTEASFENTKNQDEVFEPTRIQQEAGLIFSSNPPSAASSRRRSVDLGGAYKLSQSALLAVGAIETDKVEHEPENLILEPLRRSESVGLDESNILPSSNKQWLKNIESTVARVGKLNPIKNKIQAPRFSDGLNDDDW